MVGTPPAEKHPRGLNGKPTPRPLCCHLNAGHLDRDTRPAFAGSAAVEAPTPAIVSATSHQPGTPQHQGKREGQHGPGHQPTPGRGYHLNAGHLAQLDTSTRGALQPLRLSRPRLHPRACAVGELGEICPGTGASAATSTGEGPPPTRASTPAGHLNARADPAAIVSAAASQRRPWTRGAGAPAGHLNACGWRGTKKAPNPQK